MSDLAAACDTSKSLIYHYYPSKEDILYAVMASHIDQLVEDVEHVLDLNAPPARTLDRLIHAFMDHYVGAAARQKVLLNELDSLPAEKRSIIVTKQRRIIETVQGLLTKLDPELESDSNRARVKTMLLFGMINWTHTWFNPKGPIQASTVADIALEMVSIKPA